MSPLSAVAASPDGRPSSPSSVSTLFSATATRGGIASFSVKPSRPPGLYPKEHGACAILGVPLVAALFIVGLTPVTTLLSAATVAAFLAHEPLMILAGARGARAAEAAPQARRLLVARLAVVAVCGSAAFWIANPIARVGMMVCLLFAVVESAVSATGHGRALAAQILALFGLALPSAVMLAAGGTAPAGAAQFLLIWFAGRLATTVSVRLVIAQHKASTSRWTVAAGDLLMLTAGVVCAAGMSLGDRQWLAAIPMLLAAVVLRVRPPHPRHLKTVGWSLLAVNVLSGIAVVWSMGQKSVL
ncbi:MAG: YwiC-like family protein [Fuerstiella sp.]